MTIENGSDQVTCSDPIDAGVLTDYWLGVLTGAEEEAVEEHLLGEYTFNHTRSLPGPGAW